MSGPSDLTTAYMVGLSDGKDTIKAELARKDALLTAALKRGKELAQANHELLEAIREWAAADEELAAVTGPGLQVPITRYRAAFSRATEAANVLRRLAALETEANQ